MPCVFNNALLLGYNYLLFELAFIIAHYCIIASV